MIRNTNSFVFFRSLEHDQNPFFKVSTTTTAPHHGHQDHLKHARCFLMHVWITTNYMSQHASSGWWHCLAIAAFSSSCSGVHDCFVGPAFGTTTPQTRIPILSTVVVCTTLCLSRTAWNPRVKLLRVASILSSTLAAQ